MIDYNPAAPTTAKCGSDEKVKLIALRYERGLPLFHPQDNPLSVIPAELPTGRAVSNRGHMRISRTQKPGHEGRRILVTWVRAMAAELGVDIGAPPPPELLTEFGAWIAERRKHIGLTRSALGSMLGSNSCRVEAFEDGRVSMLESTRAKIIRALEEAETKAIRGAD